MKHATLLAAVCTLLAAMPAAAQQNAAADYPNRTVRIVVSVPAGGGVDSVTRIMAEKLQQKFGQPFVIENRGGTAGKVGEGESCKEVGCLEPAEPVTSAGDRV